MAATPEPFQCADPLSTGASIDLRPLQGMWTQAQYLRLTASATQLIEFTDGKLEVLAPPTARHQAICLACVLNAEDPRNQNDYWRGADLVMEVVSPDNPRRDTQDKRHDYAEAGIPEYWIVNPLDETISVFSLTGDAYAKETVYRRGERAQSELLRGYSVDVAETFDCA